MGAMATRFLSREEAIKLRRLYYSSDRPCEAGHIAPRAVADDSCKKCNRLRGRQARYLERRRNAPPKPETKEEKLRRLNAAHAVWVKEMTAR
jgi:hypothetical protein